MLTAFALAFLAGVVARLRGGSLNDLAETTFKWNPLLVFGLVFQIVFIAWDPEWLGDAGGLGVIVISNLSVAAWLFANRALPGLGLAAAGMALNLLVIVGNGAMPVLESSARHAGVEDRLETAGLKHERLDDDTVLPWLGDAIPVPPFREVLSVGDVVLALGLARVVEARMMVGRKARHSAPRGEGSSSASD